MICADVQYATPALTAHTSWRHQKMECATPSRTFQAQSTRGKSNSDLPVSTSISAVIPTYNDAGRIPDAIRSILHQTYPAVEIIIADDGSEDDTEKVVSGLAMQHPEVPIRYTRLRQRGGVVAARNHGIRLANGEWIANCDSDDVWLPTKLQRQVEFLEKWTGAPIVLLGTCGFNVNDSCRIISEANIGPTSEADYQRIQSDGGIFEVIHSSTLFKKTACEKVGGYTTEYGAADDYHFFTRMAGEGAVIVVPERLVYYRKRIGSIQFACFTEQRAELARLVENRRRERSGLSALDREAFAAHQARASKITSLRRRLHMAGMYHYRVGAARVVNGKRLRGGIDLLLASCLDSRRVGAGLKGALTHTIGRR